MRVHVPNLTPIGFQNNINPVFGTKRGRRVTGISGSLICSKTLMELIFNPCGEFQWSPEGQIHSPHLHVGTPGIFTDAKESGVQKATGSYHTHLSLVKLQPWFLSLQWKTCLWTELHPWFLHLQWRTCPWATLMIQRLDNIYFWFMLCWH